MKFEWKEMPRDVAPEFKLWGCVVEPFQVVISEDIYRPGRFMASWKNQNIAGRQGVRVPGEPFGSLQEARAACEAQLRRLLA